MSEGWLKRLSRAEQKWRRGFGRDIVDPLERRRSFWHYNWLDHAHLRRLWSNEAQIAPGVWRSNQPTLRRLRRIRDKHGVRTVLNLRGEDVFAHFLFLQENCERLGLRLVNVKLNATVAPSRDNLLELLDAFEAVEPPLLMHCKSGADRTGLAAVLWLMIKQGKSLDEARGQLHWRHHHWRNSRAGILDEVLDLYAARLRQGEIAIDDWIRQEYTKEAAKEAFEARRISRKTAARSSPRTSPKA
ncbi:fused DSP-PTPase phosphatase/NAD kinase-like protein [Histidinibacterium aquaticum]|uniref:Protein tyrosine phosphatase n=1 Tax=Histidinibacterium aquaticum TaxID=2613962 RepID=A0A5J5GP06_9RHOB|nr:tyrosine-protein phosphatase [Histidinibacterium aquaticum]KAA9009890.1 protein tyrosine phosphatase [Histidinibacterium aquaticum]